jgi:hypothetical protein
LREKAEEIALKQNTKLKPSSGWIDEFRKCAGLGYNTTDGVRKRQ